MHSPTGYYANYEYLLPDRNAEQRVYREKRRDTRPVIGFTENGHAQVVDRKGLVVRADELLDEEKVYIVLFEISARTLPEE